MSSTQTGTSPAGTSEVPAVDFELEVPGRVADAPTVREPAGDELPT